MSTITRVAASLIGISIAAIPVAALTIKNDSDKEITVGVDTGPSEAVYKVPANGSVEVKEDCTDGCGVTGPWGFSRLVSQSDTIDTDGTSLVTDTAAAAAPAPGLVPENPIEAAATPEPAAKPASEAAPVRARPAAERPAPRRRAVAKKPAAPKAQKGPSPGSLGMLFFGPKK